MNNGDTGLLGYFSVHPPRGLKDNVIGLPRPGDLAGIGQRWQMTIHRTRLPIGVSTVIEGVKDLHFILSVDDHSAVAAGPGYPLPPDEGWRIPDEAENLKIILCLDGTGSRCHLHVTIFHLPCGRLVSVTPLRKVFAVEQNNGIGRGRGRMTEGGSGVTILGMGRFLS